MFKLVGLIVALVLFGALPAVAAAQTPPEDGDTVSSGNTQDGEIEQEAQGGGGGEGDNGNGHGGNGNAGNQAAICQQNAGADAVCDINQSQRFGAGGFVDVDRDGVHDRHERHGVGGLGGVVLARTGFDAWILALIGGVAVLGGIAMLAAHRRVSS
jgi:hypothetical protein